MNTPETIQDFIDLLVATKAKYGNLKVRRCDDYYTTNESEYYTFEDVMVVTSPVSLIKDTANESEGYLLFTN